MIQNISDFHQPQNHGSTGDSQPRGAAHATARYVRQAINQAALSPSLVARRPRVSTTHRDRVHYPQSTLSFHSIYPATHNLTLGLESRVDLCLHFRFALFSYSSWLLLFPFSKPSPDAPLRKRALLEANTSVPVAIRRASSALFLAFGDVWLKGLFDADA